MFNSYPPVLQMWPYLEVGSLQTWPNLNEDIRVGPDGITQWTWVWASPGRWWRTGKPGATAIHGVAKSDTQLHDCTTEDAPPKMTGVLIKRGNFGSKDRLTEGIQYEDTVGERPCKSSDAFASQGRPRIASACQELEDRRKDPSLELSERACSLQCLIWGLQPPAVWDDKFLLF